MKILSLIGILFYITLISSYPQETDSSKKEGQQSGKMFLNIDMANTPKNIACIDASLTREGYDTIKGQLNPLSGSSADIFMENIQAGEWHLRVDVKDNNSVIIYSGDSDVQIFAGFTCKSNLVLQPTGRGFGDIYIEATWGIPTPATWMDFTNNPVISPSDIKSEKYGVSHGSIIYVNGIYKMWYTGDAGSKHYVMYAESKDGINWIRPYPGPVLTPGPKGSWDDMSVTQGVTIYEEGVYKMFYGGWSETNGPWHIGLATSEDGINWVKHPNPAIYAAGDWEYQIGASSVIKKDDKYYLYYTGRNLPIFKIGLAVSDNGIDWVRYSGNPILTYDKSWEGTGVLSPTVYKNNKNYIVFYMNQSGSGFGRATSADGVNWIKDESNPFFTNEDTNDSWAAYKIAYPFYIRINNQDRIYYTGFISSGKAVKMGFITR